MSLWSSADSQPGHKPNRTEQSCPFDTWLIPKCQGCKVITQYWCTDCVCDLSNNYTHSSNSAWHIQMSFAERWDSQVTEEALKSSVKSLYNISVNLMLQVRVMPLPLLAVQPWCEPVPLYVAVKPSVLRDEAASQCWVVWHCKYCRAQEELSFQELSWDRDKLLTLLMWKE